MGRTQNAPKVETHQADKYLTFQGIQNAPNALLKERRKSGAFWSAPSFLTLLELVQKDFFSEGVFEKAIGGKGPRVFSGDVFSESGGGVKDPLLKGQFVHVCFGCELCGVSGVPRLGEREETCRHRKRQFSEHPKPKEAGVKQGRNTYGPPLVQGRIGRAPMVRWIQMERKGDRGTMERGTMLSAQERSEAMIAEEFRERFNRLYVLSELESRVIEFGYEYGKLLLETAKTEDKAERSEQLQKLDRLLRAQVLFVNRLRLGMRPALSRAQRLMN